MIDIHSHILPFVDDGSDDNEESIEMLKKLASQGVEKIICTPHYKRGVYELSPSRIKERFDKFYDTVKERNIPIKLYLGQEILCDSNVYDLIKQNKVLTLNGTNYILIEFNYFNYTDIVDYAYNIKTMGYVPIIAHVERYSYLTAHDLIELKSLGALIQVNSSSITGDNGKELKNKVLVAIKSGLVDFISSDAHTKREVDLLKAQKIINRKFKNKVCDDLFKNNAKVFNLN